MTKEVCLFNCVKCGKRFSSEDDAKACCKDEIKLIIMKCGLFKPNFPQKVVLYECNVCGLRHEMINEADNCEHWSDDVSDFDIGNIIEYSVEGTKGYKLDQKAFKG